MDLTVDRYLRSLVTVYGGVGEAVGLPWDVLRLRSVRVLPYREGETRLRSLSRGKFRIILHMHLVCQCFLSAVSCNQMHELSAAGPPNGCAYAGASVPYSQGEIT